MPGIRVISPEEAEKQISQFSLIFNAILLGIAFIALVVGGLSIINTMIMSVSERTQEIGLKKAIGAETRSILGEYLLESSMIGFLGGLIGMLLGLLTIYLLNKRHRVQQHRRLRGHHHRGYRPGGIRRGPGDHRGRCSPPTARPA